MLNNILNENDIYILKSHIENKAPIKLKGNISAIENIYNLDKLNHYLNNSILCHPYVNLANKKGSTAKNEIINVTKNKYLNAFDTKLSQKAILYRLAKGDTLIINHIQELDIDVRALVESTKEVLCSETNANLYYTYKESNGINTHFDDHDVIAIQCSGSKYWRVYDTKGDTSKPVDKSYGTMLEQKEKVDYQDFHLETGDLLFIPKGYWHHTETKNESSLHLALGLTYITVGTLINHILNERFNGFGEENIVDLSAEKVSLIINEVSMILSQFKYDGTDKIKLAESLNKNKLEIKLL